MTFLVIVLQMTVTSLRGDRFSSVLVNSSAKISRFSLQCHSLDGVTRERSLHPLVTPRVDITCDLIDFVAQYEETSTTALTANPAVVVPILTINGWILMQRKVTGGSVSFNQNWAEYRHGFGSAAGNDNYWLGLEKIYQLMQLGNVKLRVEVL